jgi:SM-20-related protein
MTMLPALDADDFSREPALLADALREQGACWIADWPDTAQRDALRDDLRQLQSTGGLSPAAIGRSDDRALRNDIRTDATCWLEDPRCGDPAHAFLARLDAVRTILNRTLFLGLADCEAHYAAYPASSGYARHRDRFRDGVSSMDGTARIVSWVTYLNADWSREDGGALRLYLQRDGQEDVIVDLPPVGGSVCFLSDVEHEVLPTNRERLSIAGWMSRHTFAGH